MNYNLMSKSGIWNEIELLVEFSQLGRADKDLLLQLIKIWSLKNE